MSIIKDPLGRDWEDRKIGWVYANDASRMATHRWVYKDGRRRLVYDMRRGMCDHEGRSVKETVSKLWPVLYEEESPDKWVPFPNNDEAQKFMRSLSFSKATTTTSEVEDDAESVILIK